MAKKENTASSDVLNLNDILSRPVIKTDNIPVFELENNDLNNESANFEPEPEPENAAADESRQQNINVTGDDMRLSPDDIAIIAVDMVDGIQQFVFTGLKRKMVFTEAELELLPSIDPQKNIAYPAGSREETAQAKYRKYLETIKKLPFAKDEKQRLENATIVYARTVDLKVSPLAGLMMAFGSALGTRALTVFTD